MNNFRFYRNCIGWPRYEERHLNEMIYDARTITRSTFLKHVNREDLRTIELSLGYEKHPSKGLTMADDFHVSYHKSKLMGEVCYFFSWSSIEYIFRSEPR